MKKHRLTTEQLRRRLPYAGAICGVAAAVLVAGMTGGFSERASAQQAGERGALGGALTVFDEDEGGMPFIQPQGGNNPFGAFEPSVSDEAGMIIPPEAGTMSSPYAEEEDWSLDAMMAWDDALESGADVSFDDFSNMYQQQQRMVGATTYPAGAELSQATDSPLYDEALGALRTQLAEPSTILPADARMPVLRARSQKETLLDDLARLQQEISYQQRVLELQGVVRDRLAVEQQILTNLAERQSLEGQFGMGSPYGDSYGDPFGDPFASPGMGFPSFQSGGSVAPPPPIPAEPPPPAEPEVIRPPLRPAPVVVEMFGKEADGKGVVQARILTSDNATFTVSGPAVVGGWQILSLSGGEVKARPLGYTEKEWPAQVLGVGTKAPTRLPEIPTASN